MKIFYPLCFTVLFVLNCVLITSLEALRPGQERVAQSQKPESISRPAQEMLPLTTQAQEQLETAFGAGYIGYDPTKSGRFGDKLMQYTKALWVADQYKMPFIYTPFKYSDQLKMHGQLGNGNQQHEKLIKIHEKRDTNGSDSDKNKIYLISYYFKADNWQKPFFVHTWSQLIDNEPFLEKLREHIAPVSKLSKIDIPEDRISIAVHIRKGSQGDLPLYSDRSTRAAYADKLWPYKFPPESYYIEQIKRLSEMLNNAPIYAYIFTDDSDPLKLMNRIKISVKKNNILFNIRAKGDSVPHVLNDFFGMIQFDVLIRGGSNFSQMVQLVGQFKIIIFPKHAEWDGDTMKLDVGIIDKRAQ